MRILIIPILCVCLLGFMPFAVAQTAVSPGALPGMQPGGLIGVAAAVRGTVQVTRPGQVGKVVGSGEAIYLGDNVSTDAQGQLQILLQDETVFTIGPNSTIVIDEFIYDPATDEGTLKAKVVKGAFRFVTGRIAHKKPSNMEVKLPAGSIGIRGTMVAGQSEGERSVVVLLGPGERNNGGGRPGSMNLNNEVNGETRTVNVTRAGYGSVIEGPGMAPSAPFFVPAEQLSQIMNSLAGGGSPGPGSGGGDTDSEGGGESGSELAGADTFGAMDSAGDMASILGDSSGLADESMRSVQDALDSSGGGASGQYHYTDSGVSFPGGQSYDIQFNVDFDAGQVGGGYSKISGTAGIIDSADQFEFLIPVQTSPQILNSTFTWSQLTDSVGAYPQHGDLTVTFGSTIDCVTQTFVVHNQANTVSDSGSSMPARYDGLAST